MNRTPDGTGHAASRPGRPSRTRHGTSRRGVTLVECLVTAVLLGSAASLSLQFISSIGRQQRQLQQRELALLTAGNLLEQLTAQPDQLPASGPVEDLTLPPEVPDQLPDARATATITRQTLPPPAGSPEAAPPDSDEPASPPTSLRRVVVELGWNQDNGQPARPVRLLTWLPAGSPAEGEEP